MSSACGHRSEGAVGRRPEGVGILLAPLVEVTLLLLSEAQVGFGDSLEDVVVILGDAEDLGLRPWYVPYNVNIR